MYYQNTYIYVSSSFLQFLWWLEQRILFSTKDLELNVDQNIKEKTLKTRQA